ncbi:hypothetical protein M409DRAFT_62112 [Zasmidium cellare ATCC 36951]|uniref:RNA helicase n=1 Tax=Zasmidium cellare ATCC 36951 TaxID=1080233 RepID=A0A6A6D4A6_ZASCE|nr:uncharacterized protein M409DRAFT_62112 [Zasmidium cellare ATCC 36951]KAF2173885.1 hypothetical protein M409DRAFT_62112 [Zasmidium cellare ATCC 36951]
MAKKKKPAANPARGFATTSVASKPKPETVSQAASTNASSGTATPAEKNTTPTVTQESQPEVPNTEAKSLQELSPEEFEAQLEASELQQFVERHGPKVKKDATRQVTRLQTDKRLLRGQADYLSVKDWLPDELMQQILDLIHDDLRRDLDSVKKSKLPLGDDLIAKVWQLRQCLFDLTLPSARVNEVLGWIVSHPPAESPSSSVWGLDECLDWLALNCGPEELEEYDYQKPKALVSTNVDAEETPATDIEQTAKKHDSPISKSDEDLETADQDEIEVSDVESDLEPDELLSVHLRTRAKLYELDPNAEQGSASKSKASKAARTSVQPASKSVQRLRQKLSKIESDVLFDKRQADAHWAGMKIDLARDAAERRKLQLQQHDDAPGSVRSSTPIEKEDDVNDKAERLGQELLNESAEDGDLLSGMFDALPGVNQAADGTSTSDSNVTIRDFGRLTGMNPKRVLEEACKARDSRCKLQYKMVSPTTYACRHSVSVQWSKEQEPIESDYLQAVSVTQKASSLTVTATTMATPDVAQSEAFVATVALFLIFSGSPKEEKAHLRLPPTFRDLWDECARMKQGHLLAVDGTVVKEVRQLVEANRNSDDDDDDEVVFNISSRRRLDGASGAATPVSRTGTPKPGGVNFSEELQQTWLQKVASPSYQHMLVARMNLPMFHFRAAALDTIQRNQVTILCGETGCGKSTQLPAFILEHELSNGRQCKIYCTEPRRISAISLAQRVSEEMGERKGDVGTSRSLVGYAIRLESQTVAQTRLVYATVGIVLRMLENSDGLSDITHLVIDEVHERSIDTDFLLIVLKSLMHSRPDLKVVLMSATVDAQRFSQYLQGAPIINVPGRTFPVTAKFLEDAIELTGHTNEDASQNAVDEDSAEDESQLSNTGQQQLQGYNKKTQNTLLNYDEYRIDYSLIVKLLDKVATQPQLKDFGKAILIFLPGIAEIRQLNDMIAGHPKFQKGWQLHPLHSTFSSEDQQAAFEIPPPGVRKIVLATNIAETGITIPDVTCVIDTGKHKEMRFDERRQMSRLIQSFVARANAKQRRGRAGRVQEGLCFHLFTKHRHDHLMVEQQTPEMLRLSLQDLVMRVKICKLGNIEQALSEALDPPSARNIRRAIDALVEVGALTEKEELTSLGNQLAKLPLDAQLGKLILLGSNFGCLDFVLTAAATLSSKSPFLNPMHAKKQADTVRLGFKRGDSDLLTVYNAYCAWRKVCTTPGLSEYPFCNKNFLSPQNLGNIEDLKAQLLSSLVDAGFVHLGPEEKTALSRMRYNQRHRNFVALPSQYAKADDNDTVATSVIAWSFYPKIIKQDGKGWRNIANNQSLGLHPTSVNKYSLSPDVKYLSFYSIMQSSSRFTNAQETSPVQEIPLLLLSGEAAFHMYAGVIIIDGNRLRLKVRDWRTMIVLKTLRTKLREVMGKLFKNPGRDLGDRPRRWMVVLERMFERQKVLHPPPQIR